MAARCALLSFAVFLAVSSASAQAPAPERRVFPVSVLDEAGQPVEGLTADDFRGEFRGQPVSVLSATLDTSPRRTGVVVDTSGSMATQNGWSLAWDVALDFIHYLGPHHELAFFTVGESLQKHVDFTRDNERLRAVFDQVSRDAYPRGGSTLYEGLVSAARELAPKNGGGVLYLISDVGDTGSSLSLSETEEALIRAGIRVFLVRVPSNKAALAGGFRRTRAVLDSVRGKRAARRLAKTTGGMSVELPRWLEDRSVVARVVRRLYRPITRPYRLEVEFGRPIDKRREWKLEVVDAEDKKRKDVEVLYPHLLVPREEN